VPDLITGSQLAGISAQVNSLGRELQRVHAGVADVAARQDFIHKRLESLIDEFLAFISEDARHKEVALAETRLVKTRQELETNFGSNADIRDRATGILRSMDVGVVRDETVRNVTEQLMLGAPHYWLAPALVALASWLGDRKELADRALGEALKRDDYKTSLFFALVSRRALRREAAAIWLDRYFRLQDPYALDREVIVLLDAVALGAFGREARTVLLGGIGNWLDEVAAREDFVVDERRRWKTAFEQMSGVVSTAEFPYLRKYGQGWSTLERSLASARGHNVALAHFGSIFDGEIIAPPSLEDRIDELLERLVADFDDAELPLRRQERHLQLIIEEDGHRAAADQRFDSERSAYDEKSSFVAVLTTASLAQGYAATSRGTQRLAIALSRPWITEAHDEHVAGLRGSQPASATIAIEGWNGTMASGSDEDPMIAHFYAHVDQREREDLAALRRWTMWIPGGVGGLFLLYGISAPGALVFALVFFIIQACVFFGKRSKEQQLRAFFAQQREAGPSIIRGSVAEWIDYRAAWTEADGVAHAVRDTLTSLTPDHFVVATVSAGERRMTA
jgi:hypothetical protein